MIKAAARAAPDHQQPQIHRGPSRGYLQRRGLGNPYRGTGSQVSRFPFASRISNNPAPLFYSATDEFREEDDGAEHDREVADFYALQQSRRDFGGARLSDSSEDENALELSRSDHDRGGGMQSRAGPITDSAQGIKSSWNGEQVSSIQDLRNKERHAPQRGDQLGGSTAGIRSTSTLAKSRGKLVDVNLNSTIHEADEDLMDDYDQPTAGDFTQPPSLQQLRREAPHRGSVRKSKTFDSVNEGSPFLSKSRIRSPDGESELPLSSPTSVKTHNYDVFWSTIFLIDVVAMLSTFFLVYLHTSAPKKSGKYGDTIYTTMHSSFYLLAIDTLVAVIVALVWLAALRSFVRPLVYLILAAVPIIAISFSLYPFASSFKGATHGKGIQDKAMRWISLLPGIFAVLWSYTVYRGRKSLNRAIGLLEFAMRILADSPILIVVGFAYSGTCSDMDMDLDGHVHPRIPRRAFLLIEALFRHRCRHVVARGLLRLQLPLEPWGHIRGPAGNKRRGHQPVVFLPQLKPGAELAECRQSGDNPCDDKDIWNNLPLDVTVSARQAPTAATTRSNQQLSIALLLYLCTNTDRHTYESTVFDFRCHPLTASFTFGTRPVRAFVCRSYIHDSHHGPHAKGLLPRSSLQKPTRISFASGLPIIEAAASCYQVHNVPRIWIRGLGLHSTCSPRGRHRRTW